jgi:hypothetical protein
VTDRRAARQLPSTAGEGSRPDPDAARRRRRRREVKAASERRRRRGDYFFRRVVTAAIRARLVRFGMIRSSEEDDRAAVRQALDDIIADALHLKDKVD